jgi:membrane-bound ClpP family serine protease
METVLLVGLGLLAVSLILIFIEALVPSGGIIGLVAGCCAIAGVVALFRYSAMWGASGLLTVVILGPMCFFWAIKMLPHSAFGRKLIGPDAAEIARGVGDDLQADRARKLALIGQTGKAVTDLRPIGVVEINGQRFDAAAEVGLIDRGTPVRVTGADAMQIRVRSA